ncbi:MAG: hypothetical protein WA948_13080 [Pontixanthobacter sp.]
MSNLSKNHADWLKRASKVRKRHNTIDEADHDEYREAAGELWRLLYEAPDAVKIAYRNLLEADLAKSETEFDGLQTGELIWQLDNDPEICVRQIGRQLRALDIWLAKNLRHEALPDDLGELLCGRGDVYLIPMARRLLNAALKQGKTESGKSKDVDRPPGPGNGYLRRAFLHHRVLPAITSQGTKVRLHAHAHLLPAGHPSREAMLGAALFPGIAIEWEGLPYNAKIKQVDIKREGRVLEKQLRSAFEADYLACIWPELCVPPSRLAVISDSLKRGSAAQLDGSGPSIVAAGSWHEDLDGRIRNVMRVLDHSGRLTLTFVKLTRFVGGGYGEANTPGDMIEVLVSRDMLISFAICSDFCDSSDIPNPFVELDVDLVLVPSLGTQAAADGHQQNAARRSNATGGQTLVVQQREPSSEGDNVGWVVSDPRDHVPPAEDRAWSERKISLK